MVVFRWDPETEELLRTENEEATRYADGVRSFDFAAYSGFGASGWALSKRS